MGEKNKYKKPDGYTTPNTILNEFHSLVTPSPIEINWDNLNQDRVFSDEPINSRIHLPPIKEVESMEKKPKKTSKNNQEIKVKENNNTKDQSFTKPEKNQQLSNDEKRNKILNESMDDVSSVTPTSKRPLLG